MEYGERGAVSFLRGRPAGTDAVFPHEPFDPQKPSVSGSEFKGNYLSHDQVL